MGKSGRGFNSILRAEVGRGGLGRQHLHGLVERHHLLGLAAEAPQRHGPRGGANRRMTDERLQCLVAAALDRTPPSHEDALSLLEADDDATLDVVAAAARVRRRFFGSRVKLNFLINMKSGACPEDCSYCSQGRGSEADVLKYPWLGPDSAADLAHRAALDEHARRAHPLDERSHR